MQFRNYVFIFELAESLLNDQIETIQNNFKVFLMIFFLITNKLMNLILHLSYNNLYWFIKI